MPDNDLYVIAMPISFTLSEDTTKLYNSAMFLEFKTTPELSITSITTERKMLSSFVHRPLDTVNPCFAK